MVVATSFTQALALRILMATDDVSLRFRTPPESWPSVTQVEDFVNNSWWAGELVEFEGQVHYVACSIVAWLEAWRALGGSINVTLKFRHDRGDIGRMSVALASVVALMLPETNPEIVD